ncbi:MAG: EAL domain-containing protein [Anaerovoracaceae bacterium]|jgi:EAL domain-containing protein (putative c-di-GMP-specific phosphodiesterase class I)/GGDEF domain-containing protein
MDTDNISKNSNAEAGIGNGLAEHFADDMPGAGIVLQWEKDCRILYTNQKVLELFGCDTPEEFTGLTGGTFWGMVYEQDREEIRSRWINAENLSNEPKFGAGKNMVSESEDRKRNVRVSISDSYLRYRIQNKSGEVIPVYHYYKFIQDPKYGKLCYLLIYPQMKSEQEEDDALTGLPGTKNLQEYAAKVVEEGRDNPDFIAYCIFFTLTNLKNYNVKQGIDKGNEYLRKTADVLKECFPGDYVARFFAANFAIFSTSEDALTRLRRAHDAVSEIDPESGIELKAGLYIVEADEPFDPVMATDLSITACEIILHDETEFYQIYDYEVAKGIRRKNYVEENIDRAIEKKQIIVYYQPMVRSISGRLCAFEALARWNSPWYGFLNPAEFISTLEESRQIHKLDIYVVREVCRKLREEMDAGRPTVPISINFSKLDFVLCDPFMEIESAVRQYGIPRDMLRIEITEGTVLEDRAIMPQVISRFRDAGYYIWMDDFGIGYSSLNVLKDCRFDALKIDMEFMHGFTDTSQEIVSSTVRMAKKIRTHTVSEGVETQE